MPHKRFHQDSRTRLFSPKKVLAIALLLTAIIYWAGLHGSWLFDDYPNIVDNPGVQPEHFSFAALVRAALSSPASDFKRPLASLSFALNDLAAGMDPYAMKVTNLVVHLLNGVLLFFLSYRLIAKASPRLSDRHASWCALLVTLGWLLLPINLTAVLYVVQRMESMANLFVLAGLIGYVAARSRMLSPIDTRASERAWGAFVLCCLSLIVPTALGVLAKETAVMLPLYAFVIEWVLFRFRAPQGNARDWRIGALFLAVLIVPALAGLAWLLPGLLQPSAWATRDFTLGTRLLSEARVVVDYIGWTLLPTPHALSFYHDNFVPSSGLLSPWTTLASLCVLLALLALAIGLRKRLPLVSLGMLLFFGCHLLTATILPLELVYEHRNYFASFGLLLAVVPLLTSPTAYFPATPKRLMWAARGLLGVLMLVWAAQTAVTAVAWGDPLKLAQTLAERAPDSPRAQYELGRTYIIYSHYDPLSPYTRLAYAPLERAAALPASSILPQQALIFMNARMRLPLKDAWWDSLIAKLAARRPGVQDESSLVSLVQCERDGLCDLPKSRMTAAFDAALSHPQPSARLLATYSDYAWNMLGDHSLGETLLQRAIQASPHEPAYRITLIRMLIIGKQWALIPPHMEALERMNIGGRLGDSITSLKQKIAAATPSTSASALR